MITDNEIRELVEQVRDKLIAAGVKPGDRLPSQVYNGRSMYEWEGQLPGACYRHIEFFEQTNKIPRYCHSCFKISIKPRDVTELIKLLRIFEDIHLPNDNFRKCFVECRKQIVGSYAGLIYTMDLDEAVEIAEQITRIVNAEIGDGIPVIIKRGCSEFGIEYPDYAKVDAGKTFREYDESWTQAEEEFAAGYEPDESARQQDAYYREVYDTERAAAIFYWLMYASSIGDTTYISLTGCELPGLNGLERPS